MMNDLVILNQLINDKALVPIEQGNYGKFKVTLIEPKNTEFPKYSVDINGIPKNAMVIKIDAFPAPNAIFKNSKGECKRADFAIITDQFIILIELKSGKGNNLAIIQQLKGAQAVIDYCRVMVKNFWNESNFLDINQYEYRFVSIKCIGLNKKPVYQRESAEPHNLPEKMLKITAPKQLQFKQLIISPA